MQPLAGDFARFFFASRLLEDARQLDERVAAVGQKIGLIADGDPLRCQRLGLARQAAPREDGRLYSAPEQPGE